MIEVNLETKGGIMSKSIRDVTPKVKYRVFLTYENDKLIGVYRSMDSAKLSLEKEIHSVCKVGTIYEWDDHLDAFIPLHGTDTRVFSIETKVVND